MCSEQPAPPAKPGRFWKMQDPWYGRVCRSPSSSFETQPVSVPTSWCCQISGVSLATCPATRFSSSSSEKWAPERAAAVVRAARLDALAAASEDAVPARGQPCQIAPEDLLVVGGIRELHPRASEVEPLLVLLSGDFLDLVAFACEEPLADLSGFALAIRRAMLL